MNKEKKRKMKDVESNDLFDYFNDYLKETIAEDLKLIHGRKPRIVDHEEPWAFYLDK